MLFKLIPIPHDKYTMHLRLDEYGCKRKTTKTNKYKFVFGSRNGNMGIWKSYIRIVYRAIPYYLNLPFLYRDDPTLKDVFQDIRGMGIPEKVVQRIYGDIMTKRFRQYIIDEFL
jgi:hypothetical protein